MNQHTTKAAKTWLQAIALTAALVVASGSAQAQYRKSGGRALDANNRVGSGGDNGEGAGNGSIGTVSGNQIVTGNVTGGKEFRGPVGYSDPNEFRGSTGFERSDRFVRNSSGARSTVVQSPSAFYGNRLIEPLPAQTYRPSPDATGTYTAVAPLPAPGETSTFGQVRPGTSGLYDAQLETLPGSENGGALTASPLYGVRPLQPFQTTADFLANDPMFNTSGDRLRNSDNDIRRMRDELNGAAQQQKLNDAAEQDAADPNAATPGSPAPLNAPLGGNVAQPGSGLNNKSLNSAVAGNALGGADLGTGQSARNRLLVPPSQQSQQYKELVRRMQNRTGETDASEDSRDFNLLRNAQAQGKKSGQPGKPGEPDKAPGQAPAPGAVPAPRSPSMVPPAPQGALPPKSPEASAGPATPVEPLEIKSLATGVQAKGLANLLTSAEQLMKDQKYESAVGLYDQAGRVAPNNPMITLGRANALLGAGNYGQAEMGLRRAIGAEPALLLGKYDLSGFFGEERVKFLVKDLKEVAVTSPKEVRPNFLLAYISYNTGNGPDAEKYLAAAEKLAPKDDQAIAAMRKTWAVVGGGAPATPPAAPADLNK